MEFENLFIGLICVISGVFNRFRALTHLLNYCCIHDPPYDRQTGISNYNPKCLIHLKLEVFIK